MSTCKHTVPCGCGDKALTTPPPCNTSGPCAGEPCAELFSNQCIVYTGPTVEKSINGALFTINTGDRIDATLQKLMQALSSTDPEDIIDAAAAVRVTDITSTGFTVTFEGLDANTYTINAQQQVPLTNNLQVMPLASYSYTYAGLISGQDYKISVEESGGWTSPILNVTLP